MKITKKKYICLHSKKLSYSAQSNNLLCRPRAFSHAKKYLCTIMVENETLGRGRNLLQSRKQLVTFNFQFCGTGAKGFVVAYVSLFWWQCINVISDVLMHNLIPPERVLNIRQTINKNNRSNKPTTKDKTVRQPGPRCSCEHHAFMALILLPWHVKF